MAVFCITTSNPEFQKLLAESGEKQGVFAMMVSKWMTENEVYDRYPTLQELGISPMTSVKPGVAEVFESNPELATIGTSQQYSQYLDTITNEVIVYKGLRDKSTKVHDTPNHSYFTPNRVIADKWYKDERGVKTFVIPKVASVEYKSDFSQGISKVRKDEETFINTAKEPLIKLNTIDIGAKQVQYVLNKNITALELGSKQDLEGFKSFVGNVGDVATDIGLDMSSDEAKAFNSLVNDGTIEIKCE
jgi:hypothetical protein